MLRFAFVAALLAATPALAQTQSTGSPEPQAPTLTAPQQAIADAASAFGQCVATGVRGVAATVTPEAGAASVLGGCAAQKQQLVQAAETYIATMPEDRRATAQQMLRSHLAEAETQIAAAIRQQREGAGAEPGQ